MDTSFIEKEMSTLLPVGSDVIDAESLAMSALFVVLSENALREKKESVNDVSTPWKAAHLAGKRFTRPMERSLRFKGVSSGSAEVRGLH